MMSDERCLLDANILIYAASPSAPQHISCRQLLEAPQNLCVTPQVLAEFYSVVTNPKRVSIPFTPSEARTFVAELITRLEILPIPAAVVNRWSDWVERHAITGANIFDLQLAATMLENNIYRIYTYNRADFSFLPQLEVLTPRE